MITKKCGYCNNEFIADNREHNRGNAKYCSLQCSGKSRKGKNPLIKRTCITCKKEYETRSEKSLYCSKPCKSKNYRNLQKSEDIRTTNLQKILGHLPCEICNWNESVRDVHHIIPVSKGGKNNLNNLIVLCPNHHRMIHNNLVSKENIENVLKFRLYHHPELYLEQDTVSGN